MSDEKLLALALAVGLATAAASGGTFAVLLDDEEVTLDVVANVPDVGNSGNSPVGNAGNSEQPDSGSQPGSVSSVPLFEASVADRGVRLV